jgi:hypothetical protein
MNSSSKYASASPVSTAAAIHLFIASVRNWLYSLLDLVVLEGKKASFGLALMLVFAVGAVALLAIGWLALVGCAVAALVENKILGLTWSLLLVALLNFGAAGGLVLLAIQRSQDILFSATRRHLGLKSVSTSSHE